MKFNNVLQGLTLALILMALSLLLAWAGRAGLVAGDLPTRAVMAFSSLVIAFYGNAIPKRLMRSERALAARRLSGWVMVLAGLGSAAAWILAPVPVALPLSMSLIGGAVVLVLGTCLLTRLGTPAA